LDEVKKQLTKHKLEVAKSDNIARGIDKLWKNIRKDIAGPIWLINTPLFISPLAKTNPDKPETVQRFQPVIAGSELGNGFSELNDPIDQLNRFNDARHRLCRNARIRHASGRRLGPFGKGVLGIRRRDGPRRRAVSATAVRSR
jgi:lysyl-tRNA synthetase class II